VEYQRRTFPEGLYVVTEEYDTLLGQTWICNLSISLQEIDSEEFVNSRALEVHNVAASTT
jgi:hypothetical protein